MHSFMTDCKPYLLWSRSYSEVIRNWMFLIQLLQFGLSRSLLSFKGQLCQDTNLCVTVHQICVRSAPCGTLHGADPATASSCRGLGAPSIQSTSVGKLPTLGSSSQYLTMSKQRLHFTQLVFPGGWVCVCQGRPRLAIRSATKIPSGLASW